jgi:phenylpropionate dioxygenase-like ring-hydroxylating dioxygenase large terminal subunit
LGRGPIFLNIQAEPDVGLKEYLGELAQRLETYPFERMRLAHSSYVDLKANWKAASDAFLEGYHVGTVHKTTIPEGFKASRTNQARMNPGAFKICGRHRIASGPRSPSYEANPIERVSMEMGLPSFLQGIKPGEFLWPGLNFANVPLPTWTMDQHAIFPNSHIFIGQGFGWTHEFHPRSVGETRHEWRFYVAEPQTWSQRIGQYFLPVQAREGEMEDVAVIEKVQRGIAGGALKHIHLSDQEIAIRHQYRSVESLVRD